jgi:hypothetical protein
MITMNKFMLGCEEVEQECEQSERRAGALEKDPTAHDHR